MQTRTLQNGVEAFKVSVHEAAKDSPVVLFAVGAGGQPERFRDDKAPVPYCCW
ncbi:MAG: hypothetical protein WA902_01250 [Thermosynechococcaceae cyanobacterium]